MMITACYKSGNDKSDNNENKVGLLLRRWGLVGHMLDHILDYLLDYILDYIIIDLITTVLQKSRKENYK